MLFKLNNVNCCVQFCVYPFRCEVNGTTKTIQIKRYTICSLYQLGLEVKFSVILHNKALN